MSILNYSFQEKPPSILNSTLMDDGWSPRTEIWYLLAGKYPVYWPGRFKSVWVGMRTCGKNSRCSIHKANEIQTFTISSCLTSQRPWSVVFRVQTQQPTTAAFQLFIYLFIYLHKIAKVRRHPRPLSYLCFKTSFGISKSDLDGKWVSEWLRSSSWQVGWILLTLL